MNQPLAIIDSGLGGLAITEAIWKKLPFESTLYLADHQFFPYGEKTEAEINRRLIPLIDFCLANNCRLVVIACNTITASAIDFLRSIYPMPIIGTAPAIKPALKANLAENIAVLVTSATSKSRAYQKLIRQFDLTGQVKTLACPGLAQEIEEEAANPAKLKTKVKQYLDQLNFPFSALVLGCTHYILIKDLIRSLLPPGVKLIEPSEAISRQVENILLTHNWLTPTTIKPARLFYTTGERHAVSRAAAKLMKRRIIFTSCSL